MSGEARVGARWRSSETTDDGETHYLEPLSVVLDEIESFDMPFTSNGAYGVLAQEWINVRASAEAA